MYFTKIFKILAIELDLVVFRKDPTEIQEGSAVTVSQILHVSIEKWKLYKILAIA